MIGEVGRYLWWWVVDNRWYPFVVTVPFMLIAGPAGIVWAVGAGDWETLWIATVILLAGLWMLVSPTLSYLNKPKPWRRTENQEGARSPEADARVDDAGGDRISWGGLLALAVIWSSAAHRSWFHGPWIALWVAVSIAAAWLIGSGWHRFRRAARTH